MVNWIVLISKHMKEFLLLILKMELHYEFSLLLSLTGLLIEHIHEDRFEWLESYIKQ